MRIPLNHHRFIDPLIYKMTFIDANILNCEDDGEGAALGRILKLNDEEGIILFLPYSVQEEVNNPNTPEYVKQAARKFLFSCRVQLTAEELERYRKLVDAVKGNAKEKNIKKDLFHVAEAAKYGSKYFLTRDKRLLARSQKIAQQMDIAVLTPSAFMEKVDESRNGVIMRNQGLAL